MSFGPQEIQAKEFRESFRGYNEDDVDTFLDDVAEEFARLHQENQRLKAQLSAAQQELRQVGQGSARAAASPAPPGASGLPFGRAEAREEMKRALVAAQKAAETAIEEARRRASEIVARAEQRAGEIDKLMAQRALEVDSDAGAALSHAERRVEDLHREESEVNARLRRLLTEHVRLLQSLDLRSQTPAQRQAPRAEEVSSTPGEAASRGETPGEAAPGGDAPTIGPRSAAVERMAQEFRSDEGHAEGGSAGQ